MSGIDIEFYAPIEVEMPDALPPMFSIEFENHLPLDVNFGIPGPQGERGPQGDISTSSINDLADVEIANLQNGDTLVFSNSRFVNQNIATITDGGNF
jgi:hypothetical protein